MLDFLQGKAGDRKLRLFAVACCRRVWDQIKNCRSRKAVEIAEGFADGTANSQALQAAYNQAPGGWPAANLATSAALPFGDMAAGWVVQNYCHLIASQVKKAAAHTRKVSGRHLCSLFRDIWGPLSFRSLTVDPSWLTWNGGTVVRLAQAIYDHRAFGDLPVLADALEEAGCPNPDILAHCRSGGDHVRGCWALDLLLGKT
jgi:hypothetical protein